MHTFILSKLTIYFSGWWYSVKFLQISLIDNCLDAWNSNSMCNELKETFCFNDCIPTSSMNQYDHLPSPVKLLLILTTIIKGNTYFHLIS